MPSLPRPVDAVVAEPPNTLAALGRTNDGPARRVPVLAAPAYPAAASTAPVIDPASEISEATPSPRFAVPRSEAPEAKRSSAPSPRRELPVAPPPEAAPRRKPRPRGASTAVLVVQGLVVGGGIGFLLVLLLVIGFLLRRYV